MRQTGHHAFLGRQMTQCLHLPDFIDLVFPAQQQGIVVVNSEHPVAGYAVGGMEHMYIPADVSGTFPLIDIQAGGAGKHDVCLQHVHPGKSPVAFTGELCFDMLIFLLQQGIIRRSREVQHGFPALFHLVAEGLENGPVTLAVGEKYKGDPGRFPASVFSAAEQNLQFHPAVPQGIDGRTDDADQDREQHASRARVDVENHIRGPPSCSRRTGFGFSTPAAQDP